jgi:hypothetical protein
MRVGVIHVVRQATVSAKCLPGTALLPLLLLLLLLAVHM